MKGESVSSTIRRSRCWVSLSRKRLASMFISCTLSSMLLSSRRLLMFCNVASTEHTVNCASCLRFSAFSSNGMSVVSASDMMVCRFLLLLELQLSAPPRCFSTVFGMKSLSSRLSLVSRSKYLCMPLDLPPARSSVAMPASPMALKNCSFTAFRSSLDLAFSRVSSFLYSVMNPFFERVSLMLLLSLR